MIVVPHFDIFWIVIPFIIEDERLRNRICPFWSASWYGAVSYFMSGQNTTIASAIIFIAALPFYFRWITKLHKYFMTRFKKSL
jgi:hypothetical protein